jgi:hypothetical protein
MLIKQLGVFLCTLYVIPCMVRADLGLPCVQAVCEVRLNDGTKVEGVVLVATGGYLLKFDNYGFLLLVERPQEEGIVGPTTIELAVLFDPTFYAIQPHEGIVERSPRSQSGPGRWFREPKKYFLRDVTYREHFAYGLEVKSEYDSTDLPLLLRRDLVDHRVYELLDYVPIYTKVPEELYLTREIHSVKQLRIKVENIQRFALVFEPSQRWLDEIAAVWWHDIIKRQEDYKDSFKKWDFYR